MHERGALCEQDMLDRARQRRAVLEARLSNSDLSDGHKSSAEINHGVDALDLLSFTCNC